MPKETWERKLEELLCTQCDSDEPHEIIKCTAENHPNYFPIRNFTRRQLSHARREEREKLAEEVERLRPVKPYANASNGYKSELGEDENAVDVILLEILSSLSPTSTTPDEEK